MERCVKDVMRTGKDKSSAIAICHSKMGKESTQKNVVLEFVPEFTITESNGWLEIGGTALVPGISRNDNEYTFENLQENDGRSFKWIVGHPEEPEEHIVGMGKFTLVEGRLMHEGRIKNTARHPDIIEQVKDRFLGPSIHATAKRIVKKGDKFNVEGLTIDGLGFVAFQGVGEASIDYAIAESFNDTTDKTEETKDKEVANMPEEGKEEPAVEAEAPAEEVEDKVDETEDSEEEDKAEEEPAEESLKKLQTDLQKEIKMLKESRKQNVIEQIISVNKELTSKDLLKERMDKLKLILEYETKLSKSVKEEAIVDDGLTESETSFTLTEGKDGSVSLSESAYKKFNDEIKNRI